MKYLTVRHVDPELAAALERERKRSGNSLNATVLSLLRRALGVGTGSRYSNGLARQAGGWTEEEFREFERSTQGFEKIDEEAWT